MSDYYVMDSRASYDTDAACIIECFEARSEKQALIYARRHWRGYSHCLCAPNDDRVLEFVAFIDE